MGQGMAAFKAKLVMALREKIRKRHMHQKAYDETLLQVSRDPLSQAPVILAPIKPL